jgi:hypothetical protein
LEKEENEEKKGSVLARGAFTIVVFLDFDAFKTER